MRIQLSEEAYNAVRKVAMFPLADLQSANGTYDVSLSDELVDRLNDFRFDNESLSDLIVRMCNFYQTNGKLQ